MKCPPFDPNVKSVVTNPSRLVCGTDGNTYRNLCEIRRTACLLGRSIPAAYRGPCKGQYSFKLSKTNFKKVQMFPLTSSQNS